MYIERTLSKALREATDAFPVVLVTGARETGKTTMMEQCRETSRIYVTLDDREAKNLAQGNPQLFLQTCTPPLLIDEIHQAPELLPYIKAAVDDEKTNGMFWLASSQKFLFMKSAAEILAGQVKILELMGLSQAEADKREETPFLPGPTLLDCKRPVPDIFALYEKIFFGSHPKLHASIRLNRSQFYSSYIKTYIEHDVRQLMQSGNESRFAAFMEAAANRNGQLLNYVDLSKELRVGCESVKLWLSVLEASGIIFFLPSYYIAGKTIKIPRLYFADTGLCCYLCGWQAADTLAQGDANGAMLKGFIISEIIKSYRHNGLSTGIYFYHGKYGKELDLLIERDGLFYPIEIKRNSSLNANSIKNFGFRSDIDLPTGTAAIICLCNKPDLLNEKTAVIPAGIV
jgi:predicted AAA+ superfamily ATPase